MNSKLLFVLIISCISLNAKALTSLSTPPDSTAKLLDRAGAMLLIDDGRVMFDEGKVKDALNLFREAAAKDPYSWKAPFWIAQCHFSLSNYGFALKYAKDALKNDPENVDKEVFELIGRSFHQTGQIDSALEYYNKSLTLLSKTRIDDLRLNEKIAQCTFTKQQIAEGKKSKRMKLTGEVNTGYNEYAPLLTHNGKIMYFTSRRSNTKGGKTNSSDQEYYEDIYRAEWNEEEQIWDSVTNELDRVNSVGFDAFSYITPDGLHALLTWNTYDTDNKTQTKSSDICEVTFTDKGKWSTPKIIKNKSINSTFYDGAATLTADGNTMYFVTDRKGDKKSTEIYYATKTGKKWGEAKPVSDSINTIGRETTPVISADGRYLFFSSDGHPGMGGLDVFVSENLGENVWSKPVNLGIIVNTVNNDTHFHYYPELKKAMMAASEVVGQKSSIDIYEVDMTDFVYPKK